MDDDIPHDGMKKMDKKERSLEELVKIHEKVIGKDTIIFTRKTSKWCRLPYPGKRTRLVSKEKLAKPYHATGCPNAGKSKNCPPSCRYRDLFHRRPMPEEPRHRGKKMVCAR
jgi:hypothetical protein